MCDVDWGVEGRLCGGHLPNPPLIFTIFGLILCPGVQTLFSQVFLISSHLLILFLTRPKLSSDIHHSWKKLYTSFRYYFIYLLENFFKFYFQLHWVFVAACGLSLVVASGGYSLLRCAGFSLWWLLLLRSIGSRRAGFSSCSTWAQ